MSEVILATGQDDEMLLNMGPHHPSTHGVLRFIVQSDGEIIRKVTCDVGYLHRSIEKIAERCTFPGFMPYTDRVDYLAAMFANEAWAVACERLMDVKVPPRAQLLRAISCELNRIVSHLVAVGAMAMDIGAVTPFSYMLREREYINDFIEELCGARLTYNYHRIGGVSFDVPENNWESRLLRFLDHFDPMMDEFDRLITFNDIFIRRLSGVATASGAEAIAWGLVGPNLRASGVDWDLRRDAPYGAYPELKFEVPSGVARMPDGKGGFQTVGVEGDCFARFWIRTVECRESSKIVRQCLEKLKDSGDAIVGELPRKLKPEGEAYARIESARGDMGCYVIANGKEEPYRARFRTGSFNSMGFIQAMSPGLYLADLVALIASLDIVAPEIDR